MTRDRAADPPFEPDPLARHTMYSHDYWTRNSEMLLALADQADRLVCVPWAVDTQAAHVPGADTVASSHDGQLMVRAGGELQLDPTVQHAIAGAISKCIDLHGGLLRQPQYDPDEVRQCCMAGAIGIPELQTALPEPLIVSEPQSIRAAHMTPTPKQDGIGITVCRTVFQVDTADTTMRAYDIEETHRGVVRSSQIMMYGRVPFAALSVVDVAGMCENLLVMRGVEVRRDRQRRQMAGRVLSELMLDIMVLGDREYVPNLQANLIRTSLLRFAPVPDCHPNPRLLQSIHYNLQSVITPG